MLRYKHMKVYLWVCITPKNCALIRLICQADYACNLDGDSMSKINTINNQIADLMAQRDILVAKENARIEAKKAENAKKVWTLVDGSLKHITDAPDGIRWNAEEMAYEFVGNGIQGEVKGFVPVKALYFFLKKNGLVA
jgi:hypothetical protein